MSPHTDARPTARPSAAVLDAHLHLWDPARFGYGWLDGDLARRFAGDELAAATAGLPERAFVFVQAEALPQHDLAEVDWVATLDVPVRGIVARAELERGSAIAAHIAALRARPLVVGVRRLLQGEPAGFATDPAFLDGARIVADAGLTFDACVTGHAQLADVAALATAIPTLSVVLDHLGKPDVGNAADPQRPSAEWIDDLRRLADLPNVTAKLSGLPGEARGPWRARQLEPFLDAALAAFGAQRLMYASDWPASHPGDATAGYARWELAVTDWIAASGVNAHAVWSGTATRVYGLG